MGKTHMSCFLCGFDKNQNLFYRFPQDESRRLQWATAIGLSPNEIPTYSRLCRNHFVEDDFHTPNFTSKNMKIRLRQSAVPSLLLEMRRRRLCQINSTPSICEESTTTDKKPVQNRKASNENTANCNFENSTLTGDTVNENTDIVDSSVNWEMEEPNAKYSSLSEQLSVSVKSNGEQNLLCEPELIQTSTPTSHEVRAVRHAGDIRTPNLSSPKKARFSVQLLEDTIAKLQHEKKMLLLKVRRDVKKIKALNELIGHLKQSNLISDSGCDS